MVVGGRRRGRAKGRSRSRSRNGNRGRGRSRRTAYGIYRQAMGRRSLWYY